MIAGTHVGIGEHTPGSAVELAAGEAESAGADLLVSVGGGSVVDGTKAVARQLGYPAQVAVPTTLSGAEWAHRVGVTDEAAGKKAGFADPGAVPPVVILDPDATIFTPERLWLSTGIRALDHAVEGFLYGGDHPVTDVTGLEGARRLMGLLPLSRAKPDDLGARAELQRPPRGDLVHHPRPEPRGGAGDDAQGAVAEALRRSGRGSPEEGNLPGGGARVAAQAARRGRARGRVRRDRRRVRRAEARRPAHTERRVLT